LVGSRAEDKKRGRGMRFYSQFKPFNCTSLKMFPSIWFTTTLGHYPVLRMEVIFVVPPLNCSETAEIFTQSWQCLGFNGAHPLTEVI